MVTFITSFGHNNYFFLFVLEMKCNKCHKPIEDTKDQQKEEMVAMAK